MRALLFLIALLGGCNLPNLDVEPRLVPGTGETYGQRVVDPPNESQVEPALLPLPAPVLIGGVAVASALILRQRLRR